MASSHGGYVPLPLSGEICLWIPVFWRVGITGGQSAVPLMYCLQASCRHLIGQCENRTLDYMCHCPHLAGHLLHSVEKALLTSLSGEKFYGQQYQLKFPSYEIKCSLTLPLWYLLCWKLWRQTETPVRQTCLTATWTVPPPPDCHHDCTSQAQVSPTRNSTLFPSA